LLAVAPLQHREAANKDSLTDEMQDSKRSGCCPKDYRKYQHTIAQVTFKTTSRWISSIGRLERMASEKEYEA
jgi:hypothetical protein